MPRQRWLALNPRLPRVTSTDFIRAIQRDGWYSVRQRGSHRFFAHDTKQGIVVVPVHPRRTLKLGLLGDLLKDAGLTVEGLEALL